MKRNIDGDMTIYDDGRVSYVMPGAVPHRGRGWFGVWELNGGRLSKRHRELLVAAGYTQVDGRRRWRYLTDEQWALLTPALPLLAFYLLGERFIEWANWRLARFAWNLGVLEVPEAEMFSWRRHFSPYPWRGRRRIA